MDFRHLAENLIEKLAKNTVILQFLEKTKIDGKLNTQVIKEQTVFAAISPIIGESERLNHLNATMVITWSDYHMTETPQADLLRIVFDGREYAVKEIDSVGMIGNKCTIWRAYVHEI